ncbi:MAG: SRPBCC family protein [Fidelibacterota bacterium]
MAITVAAVVLVLLILYFIRETARDQELDIPCVAIYTPKETVLETRLDIPAPPEIIWETLTSLRDYHLWFPWIRRVRVTNESVQRWAHRHSFQHYTMEVGSRFQIRPFALSPLTSCRFITLDPLKRLSMEMRFFPFIREIVTFTLTPYANVVQVDYRSISPSMWGFIPQALFSWRGKKVLKNLQARLPELPPAEELPEKAPEKEEKTIPEELLVQQLVTRALREGKEVLNSIPDRSVRAKAKSAYVKAVRSGQAPPDHPPAPAEPVSQEGAEQDQETLIQDAVARALQGDMDAINTISDRVLRARAKSAYMKAKRRAP